MAWKTNQGAPQLVSGAAIGLETTCRRMQALAFAHRIDVPCAAPTHKVTRMPQSDELATLDATAEVELVRSGKVTPTAQPCVTTPSPSP